MSRIDTTTRLVHAPAVDHGWLRTHLGWTLTGGEPISVEPLDRGGGSSCGVHRIRCGERGVIYKTPPYETNVWADWIIDAAADVREVHTYRFLHERGAIADQIAPRCYWSSLAGGRGAMALEDVGPGAAPNHTEVAQGLTYPRIRAAVTTLALLHALTLTTTPLAGPPLTFPWLLSGSSPELRAAVRAGLDDLPRALSACTEGSQEIAPQDISSAIALDAILVDAHRKAHVNALCHGDLWAANLVYTAPAPRRHTKARMIDWQFAMWGNPLTDLAMLLLSSVHGPERQAWQHQLLLHYHRILTEHSALRYSLADCLEDLRRALPFAALITLASLDGFTAEMTAPERTHFLPRMLTAFTWVEKFACDDDSPSPALNRKPGAR